MPFRFESLKIWHMAREYGRKAYKLTAGFPRKEDYGLTSQINRAANSVSLNIAEGSAKKSDKHFDLFLDNAVGSTFEVVAGGFRALDEGYIDQSAIDTLYVEGETLAKAINAFRRTLKFDRAIGHRLSAISHRLSAISHQRKWAESRR